MNRSLLIDTVLVLLAANALVSGRRGCRLVCGYSWVRCSMDAATR